MSSTHLLKQFKQAIVSALESKESDRALMRAWSAKQRFPAAQWLEGLGNLQDHAVRLHEKNQKLTIGTGEGVPRPEATYSSNIASAQTTAVNSRIVSAAPSEGVPSSSASSIHGQDLEIGFGSLVRPTMPSSASSSRPSSVVNLQEIVGKRKDFALQQVDPFFSDADETFYNIFKKKLDGLNARNSTADLCTEEYIVESTRSWFSQRHDAKVGTSSLFSSTKHQSKKSSTLIQVSALENNDSERNASSEVDSSEHDKEASSFDFGEDYVPPNRLKEVSSDQNWYLANLLFPLSPRPNHRLKLLPNHPLDRRNRTIRKQTLHHSRHLPRIFYRIWCPNSLYQASPPPHFSVSPLWISFPPCRHVAFCSEPQFLILDAKCRDWGICRGLGERVAILCV